MTYERYKLIWQVLAGTLVSGVPDFTSASWRKRTVFAVLISALALPASGQEPIVTSDDRRTEVLADGEGFPAQIVSLIRANVTSSVKSTVRKIHFEAGQTVAAGDILFTLDDVGFVLAVENAEADVKRTEWVHKAAQADFERSQKLKEKGSVSGVQAMRSQVIAATTEAILEQSQALLKVAQNKLEGTVVRAPISGIIGPPQIEIGGHVVPEISLPLAHLVQMDPISVAYKIPYVKRLEELGIDSLSDFESLFSGIVLTMKISDTWIYEYPAIIEHGSADVDPATGEMTIWAKVPNPDHLLRPGMRVTIFSSLQPGDIRKGD